MKISLNWKNRTPGADGTRIFRAQEPFDAASLPGVLDTVAGGVSTYDDSAVVSGERYYYRTQVFKGENTALSSQLEAWALPRTGPGPQQLMDGDLEVGFFGEVAATDFINGATLQSRFALPGALRNSDTNWFKFAYKGKILFTPVRPILQTVTWLDLYNAGVVYGTDDFGNQPFGLQVNQRRVITINGENFLVRLFEGRPKPVRPWANYGTDTSYPGRNTDSIGLEGSEWNDLMNRVVTNGLPFSLRKPPFIGAIPQNQVLDLGSCWTQDFDTGTKNLVRSQTLTNIGGAYAVTYSDTSYQIYVNSWNTFNPTWRPVLEWLP